MADPNLTRAHALAYIARGWSIVPLVERTKRPATKIAGYLDGSDRMTVEEATFYWTHNPNAGIAIVTGRPSGLVVVDVDPRNGGNNDEAARDCPSPLQVRTGSGGLHLYCKHPGHGAIACGRTERQGVDRKADGGYVVAPPSLHPDSGNPYVWLDYLDSTSEPLAVPEWVLRTPAPGPLEAAAERPQWIADTLKDPRQCAPGAQHETLARLAWWLSADHDQDIAQGILYLFTSRLAIGRPSEPWTTAHIDELLDSAYRKRAAQGRDLNFETRLVTPLRGRVKQASTWTVSTRNDWIVDHLVAPACFTEVIGEVKKGKTTFITQLMHALLTGSSFLGFDVRRTPVVLCTEQAELSLDATLERAGIRHHPELYFLTQADIFGLPWNDVVSTLIELCVEVDARVLFVDTLTRLAGIAGEAENAAGTVSILNAFQQAKARGIACVFVRHASKSAENRDDASRAGRGTTAFTGEMDICVLHRQRSSVEDYRHMSMVSRLGEQQELVLQYQKETGIYTVVPEGEHVPSPHRVAEEKREVVKRAFEGGARTTNAIHKQTGLAKETVRKYLREFTGSVLTLVPPPIKTEEDK